MKSPIPIYIQDVFAEIVSRVSAEMLPILQAIYPQITGVHYQYGTGYEIIETLNQMTQNDNNLDKYPLVCLFLDVNEEFGTDAGIYSTIPNLRIAICNDTKRDMKAPQRDELNFKPILTPIYQSLLRQMKYSKAFKAVSLDFRHDAKRNYFWGREGVYGKEGSVFNDKLDAIEITFKDLKISTTYCPPGETV